MAADRRTYSFLGNFIVERGLNYPVSAEIPETNLVLRRLTMKKALVAVAVAVAFIAGVEVSAQVRDWHDLDRIHAHVIDSIHELERARAANHYDMMGHGAKAEQLLRDAERELNLAVDAAKASAR
jgi:hypothetical protein